MSIDGITNKAELERFVRSLLQNTHGLVDQKQVKGTRGIPSSDEPNLKIIRGIVTTTGGGVTINEGTGFTAARISAGRVHIDYTENFSDTAAVNVTGDQGETYIVSANTDASGCRFGQSNSAGVATEGTMHFIAIGPA